MGFEKMLKIAHSTGDLVLQLISVYKQQRIEEKLKAEVSYKANYSLGRPLLILV
ncbi:hypothetical protein MTR_2g010105 [Medicago truncatula]|uniref:Uncharacterized protein n=1 Tax=Medicago truncatula TaxID=3880 RepID=A0A072V3R3_MEDTR|nr:hypothetical protein MTR_2g010105 [Medicago truncatula]